MTRDAVEEWAWFRAGRSRIMIRSGMLSEDGCSMNIRVMPLPAGCPEL